MMVNDASTNTAGSPLSLPWIAGRDLWPDGTALSGNGAVADVEAHFRALTGRRFAVAVSSATAGLWAALHAAGARGGSSALLSAYDWPSSAAVTLALGAEPVPVDVDRETGVLDERALRRSIGRTPDARAVVVTHLGGQPVALDPLLAVTRGAGVVLVEDCAQALGATLCGRSVGADGEIAVFSLGPRKLIDAGEGGVVVTDSDDLYDRIIQFGQHPLYQRLHGVQANPFHVNTRIHPAAPPLALTQFASLADRLARLRANAAAWICILKRQYGLRVPKLPESAEPSWWSFVVQCDEASWGEPTWRVAATLQRAGVPIRRGPIPHTVPDLLRDAGHRVQGQHAAARQWVRTALELPCPDADPRVFEPWARRVGSLIEEVFETRRRAAGYAPL